MIEIPRIVKKCVGASARMGLVVVFLATFVTSSSCAAGETNVSNRLVLLQGFILNAYYNDQYVEVKRLDVAGRFYGFGRVDQDTVFVAYQRPNQAEAIIDVELVNHRQQRLQRNKKSWVQGVNRISMFILEPVKLASIRTMLSNY